MRFQAPESLSEQIAQHVGQRIIVGTLKPGERIQELKVAGELDVSRGSVREALLILERRHLIHIFPRKGAVVSALSPELVNNLYDIYVHLLILLAEKVVENWEGRDLTPITKQVETLEKRITNDESDIAEVIDAGFEVMRLCYPMVQNPYLAETLENLRPAISRTYHLAMQAYRGEAERTRQFFRELVSCAQDRDRDGTASAIRNYGQHQRQIVLSALAEDSRLTAGVTS
jgi:DNA-binding GntR family transcriptional regulator